MELTKIIVGTTVGDQEAIKKYCRGHAVELGTLEGGTTRIMSRYAEDVVSIDVFEDFDLIKDEMSKDFVEGHYYKNPNKIYERVFNNLSDISNAKILKGDAVEVAKTWKDPIDCIFMDAGHQYESITSYFNAWSNHLKKGGYLLIHDTKDISPHIGCVRFANELKLFRNWEFIEQCDNIAVFKRLE